MRTLTKIALVLAVLGIAGTLAAEEEWRPPPPPDIAAVVEKAESQSIEHVKLLIWELQRCLQERLLAVPPDIAREYGRYVGAEDAGVARILERGRFDKMTTLNGDGAYFSFTTGSHDYQEQASLELQQWKFSSGFAGRSYGFVQAVAVSTIEDVRVADLPDRFREPPDFEHRGRRDWVPAEVGRVYAVRAIRFGESDVIAALKVLGKDDDGLTFVWRIVQRNEVPRRPERDR